MEERLEKLEKEISLIKDRNSRVELDKAWETSKTRALSIVCVTYICATIVLYVIGIPHYYLNAIIPTLGFFLSIQSLPFIRKIWIKKITAERA